MEKNKSKIPQRLIGLPIYNWDDDHDEPECISVGHDGKVYHQIGGHWKSLPEEVQTEIRNKIERGQYYA